MLPDSYIVLLNLNMSLLFCVPCTGYLFQTESTTKFLPLPSMLSMTLDLHIFPNSFLCTPLPASYALPLTLDSYAFLIPGRKRTDKGHFLTRPPRRGTNCPTLFDTLTLSHLSNLDLRFTFS